MTEAGNLQPISTSPIQSSLGERVAAARRAGGLSAGELGWRLGVGRETVEKWERDAAAPSAQRLRMIAGLVGVSIIWLLSGDGDEAPLPAPARVEPEHDRRRSLTAAMELVRHDLFEVRRRLERLERRVETLT